MIVFHDVDGCLNTSDGKPLGLEPESLSIEQERALEDLGRLLDRSRITAFVLNTGRSWAATEYLIRSIASAKLRFALVEHGSELWDIEAGQTVDLERLAERNGLPETAAALRTSRRIGDLIAWFHEAGNARLCRRVGHDGTLTVLAKNTNLTISTPDPIDGSVLLSALRNLIEVQPEFSEDRFVYHHSKPDGFVDVMGTMDKGLGVELLVRHIDGEFGDTVAVGNGLNDLPMLESVALPVCPANAEPRVKALCRARGHLSSHVYIDTISEWLKAEAT